MSAPPLKLIDGFVSTYLLIDQNYIEIITLHCLHFTLTVSPEIRMNFFEPQLGQIGQDLSGFISVLLVWFRI